jgi:microcompartment protein CcmL/EutN
MEKRDVIERQMEEVALHLAKNEKPDNSFEQLMQLVESIKEFDKELKASLK